MTSSRRTAPSEPSQPANVLKWNVVTVVTLLVALLSPLVTFLVWRSAAAGTASDDHINILLDAKLNPAILDLNKKLDKLNDEMMNLSGRVSKIEGRFRISRAPAQSSAAVVPIAGDEAVLDKIRRRIRAAREQKKDALSPEKLVDLKAQVQTLPANNYSYWLTVAELVNYTSHRLKVTGAAPDPDKIARPCNQMLPETNKENLVATADAMFKRCVSDLDAGESFDNVTFRDAVIRYAGGPASVKNVHFENCYFAISIPRNGAPAEPELVQAILQSPSAKNILIH